MFEQLAKNWWAVGLEGLALVLFGLTTLFYPISGVVTLVYVFGAFALVQGVFGIIAGWGARDSGKNATMIIASGVLSVLAGVIALAMPGVTLVSLYLLIAAWAFATGVVRMVAALRESPRRRTPACASGHGASGAAGFAPARAALPAYQATPQAWCCRSCHRHARSGLLLAEGSSTC